MQLSQRNWRVQGTEDRPSIEPKKLYPDRETSQKLSLGVFTFAARHWGMCFFIGVLYLFFFWEQGVSTFKIDRFPIEYPVTTLLMLGLCGGCIAFAGLGRISTAAWGLMDAISHCLLAILCWKIGEQCEMSWLLADIPASDDASPGYVARVVAFLLAAPLGGT